MRESGPAREPANTGFPPWVRLHTAGPLFAVDARRLQVGRGISSLLSDGWSHWGMEPHGSSPRLHFELYPGIEGGMRTMTSKSYLEARPLLPP